ncbi:MAG: hypothetical protein H6702_25120 [Myxococcales bacterium]|nr:hypothetical protein [Myxococcales bacterium]
MPRLLASLLGAALLLAAAPAHADPALWDAAQTQALSVRRLGTVDGQALFIEHRRGQPAGDMTEHVVLLRTDPFPTATPFAVASAGKPGAVLHRLVDPADGARALTVPGVVAVLYAGFVVPPPEAFRLDAGVIHVNGTTEARAGVVTFADRWHPSAPWIRKPAPTP